MWNNLKPNNLTMKKFTLVLAIFSFVALAANAQDSLAHTVHKQTGQAPPYDLFTFGVGVGFDYGGFGLNFAAAPQQNIILFGGVGYAIAGAGYNFGAKFRLTPSHKFTPFIMGMYGYNAAVAVSGQDNFGTGSLNKLFYGPTAGIGFDFGHFQKNKGYLSVALTIPFRSPDAQNYINSLKSQGVTFNNSLPDVGFSIGYKFAMY